MASNSAAHACNPKVIVEIAWPKPPDDFVEINTDGSSWGNPGQAGAEGSLGVLLGSGYLVLLVTLVSHQYVYRALSH